MHMPLRERAVISGWQRSPWNLAVAAEMIQAIQARLNP
jgi:hypothetical protein